MRKCSNCEEVKEFSEFYKDKTQSGGHSYECKKCNSEKAKVRRSLDPEKFRQANRDALKRNYEKIRESQKKHRLENRDTILKRRKELREKRRVEVNQKESERRKEKRKTDAQYVENERRKQREYYEKHKEKMLPQHKSHQLVMYAVKLGILKRPSECQVCGSKIKIEGHHNDYSKPLEVIWLCKSCHYKADRKILNM